MVTTTEDTYRTTHPKTGLGIEIRSIDYVPAAERHGKVSTQAPFWFLGNFTFFTVAMGFIGPGMGLNFGATVLASVIGILFGTIFMAFHASQGPDLGLPQMIQSRAQFGYRGVIVPLIGTLFTFVAFNVVNTVLIAQGLHDLYGWHTTPIAVSLGIIAAIIAIFGHDWLHIAFRTMFWISLPLYAIISGNVMFGGVAPHASAHLGFTWVAFGAQFAAATAYNITYAPYVSDYTRYLPAGRGRAALVWSVYLGAGISAIWLIILGVWFGCYLGATDGMVAVNTVGNGILTHFGTVTVLVSVAALTAVMGLNSYSGALTIITGLDCFANIPLSRGVRIASVLILAVLSITISLSLTASATEALFDALSIMLYLLVPWTAVNLVDYFFVRKGNYAIADLFSENGIYGKWNWRGLLSYAAGFLASVPFFNLARLYEGPIAHALHDLDISWAPGLLVSSVLYVILSRNLDLSSERAAIAVSDKALGIIP